MELPEDILFYAFRYALGRRSYSVSTVVDELIRHEAKLHPNTKSTIVNEIDDAHRKGNLGYDDQKELWLYIRNLLDPSKRYVIEVNRFNTDIWEEVEAVKCHDGTYRPVGKPNAWYPTTRNEVPATPLGRSATG